MSAPTQIIRLPARALRERFNRLLDNPPAGLTLRVTFSRHPSRTKAHEPYCTKSQMVEYRIDGKQVALAHRYLRTDGTLGASGKPDPKKMIDGAVLYVLE